jgi:hypothetical protein
MTSYTVTGDLGRFVGGQVLSSNQDIADYYRTMVNEGADNETLLSNEQILTIVRSVPGDGEDQEIERIQLMESGSVPTSNLRQIAFTTGSKDDLLAWVRGELFPDCKLTDDHIASVVNATMDIVNDDASEDDVDLAILEALGTAEQPTPEKVETTLQIVTGGSWMAKAAVKLDADAQFNKDMDAIVASKEVVDGRAVIIEQDLRKVFGKALSEWPEWDTWKPEGDTSNREYEGYMKRTQKANGEGYNEKTCHKLWDLFEATTIAKEISTVVEEITKARDSGGSYKGISGKAQLNAERTLWNSKKNTRRATFVQAVRLAHQWDKISSMVGVSCKYIEKPDGKGNEAITKSRTPIFMWNTQKPEENHPCSINTFLKYDVEVANEKGGTWTALLDTVSREKKDKKIGVPDINSTKLYIDAMNGALFFMEEQEAGLRHALAKRDDAAIDLVRTMASVYGRLDELKGSWMRFFDEVEAMGVGKARQINRKAG